MKTKTKLTQHTPGPWRLDIYGAHPEDAIGGGITGPNSERIADLPNYGQDSGLTKASFLSSAHLIAAALGLTGNALQKVDSALCFFTKVLPIQLSIARRLQLPRRLARSTQL
jgi:hypothetical protein